MAHRVPLLPECPKLPRLCSNLSTTSPESDHFSLARCTTGGEGAQLSLCNNSSVDILLTTTNLNLRRHPQNRQSGYRKRKSAKMTSHSKCHGSARRPDRAVAKNAATAQGKPQARTPDERTHKSQSRVRVSGRYITLPNLTYEFLSFAKDAPKCAHAHSQEREDLPRTGPQQTESLTQKGERAHSRMCPEDAFTYQRGRARARSAPGSSLARCPGPGQRPRAPPVLRPVHAGCGPRAGRPRRRREHGGKG